MKKILTLTLVAIFAVMLCSCGDSPDKGSGKSKSEATTETQSIEYQSVSLDDLYTNYTTYQFVYIKTTVKITSINVEENSYSYTVYDVDDFDEVNVTVSNAEDVSTLSEGDYVTVSGQCSYESDDDNLNISIECNETSETDESLFKEFGSEEKPNKYSDGQYLVGTDIPAGTYVVYPTDDLSGYYCISKDTNDEDIIANNNFDGQNYFTAKKGQYLTLERCYALPIKEKKKVEYEDGYLTDGQYIVGDDVPAGKYKLIPTDDTGGYYSLSKDANDEDINSNDNFDGERYVTIKDGEYLTLERCKMKVK